MSKKILGLDIRENVLSAVMISGSLQGNQIEAFARIESGDTGAVDGETASGNGEDTPEHSGVKLRQMLAKLSETMDIQGAVCVASIPSDLISYRNITVPFSNEKKIRQIIHFELEPVMPESVDTLHVDFQPIGIETEEGETPLVTASVKKGLLDSFEYCLKESGFDPQSVLPGSCSAAWYLSSTLDRYRNYLFADIHDGICTLFLMMEKQPGFIRSFRIQPGNGDSVLIDIRRTVLSFCETWYIDFEPEALIVSGDFFTEPERLSAFSEAAGMVTELADFRNASGFHMENRLKVDWDPAVYDGAFALAYNVMYGIQGLRFTERFFAIGKYIDEHKKQLINTGILLLLVIIAGLGNSIFESWTVNSRISQTRKEMAALYRSAFPDAKVITDPHKQMLGMVKKARKNSTFQEQKAGNVRVIDILNRMSRALPKELNIEIDRFVLGKEDLKISGKTDSYSTVDAMKSKLEAVSLFKKVVISSTTNDKKYNSVKFKLKIELQDSGAKG